MAPQNNLITIPSIEDATRREFMFGALGAALLIACGDDDDSSPTPGSDTSTRTFTDDSDAGTVDIPADPQRIVVIYDGPRLDIPLACGVNVVGGGHSVVLGGGFAPWHSSDRVGNIADIGWVELDVEAITRLEPDLIVSQPSVQVNDLLGQVAPTAVLDATGNWWTGLDDWKQLHHRLGDLYGCGDYVQDEIAAVEERIARLRERLGDVSQLRVSVLRYSAEYGLSQYSNRLHSALLGELGVDQPASQRVVGGELFGELSLERIRELDGDVLIVFGLDEQGAAEVNQREFEESIRATPLWQSLAAVQAGQVFVAESSAHWNSTGGFEAAHLILDDLEAALIDADASVYRE